MNTKIDISQEADLILDLLKIKHGPLLFHISIGCCDGTGPVCLPVDEFLIDDSDRLLGCVSGCNVYVSQINSDLFADTQFTIDIAKGIGSAFSLEIPEGYRFKLVSNSCHFK